MAKLNEHNLDSIRRRYSQQNRELVLENAALRQNKRLLEQQVSLLKEYVFELLRRMDHPMHFAMEKLNLADSTTHLRGLIRQMEAKQRREPILSPIPENKSTPRYSLSPGTPPVVASLPEGLETPTKAIPEQGSVNVESRRRRKNSSKTRKIHVFESPPRESSNDFSSLAPINWLLESMTPPGEKNRSPIKDILLEVANIQTEHDVVVKKMPKRQRKSSRTSVEEIAIPNARSKATGPKKTSASTPPEISKSTKDALTTPARSALSTRSTNIDSPTKRSRRQKSKCKSGTLTPSTKTAATSTGATSTGAMSTGTTSTGTVSTGITSTGTVSTGITSTGTTSAGTTSTGTTSTATASTAIASTAATSTAATSTATTPNPRTATTSLVTNPTRARRGSSTPVNYKEPNLVSKMRRPSAALVDAVPGSAPGPNDNSRSSISHDSEGDAVVLLGEN